MRQQYPEVVILIISGYAEIEGIDADVPRLIKPFRERDLAHMLEDLAGSCCS